MKRFTILYNDGSTVHGGGEDDELITLTFSKKWLEAPSDGVCIINRECDVGTTVTSLDQYDTFFMFPEESHGEGEIYGANDIGAYLRQLGIVKFGGWTSRTHFHDLLAKARKDDWTPQTNEQLKERKQKVD